MEGLMDSIYYRATTWSIRIGDGPDTLVLMYTKWNGMVNANLAYELITNSL